jgi:glycosyltransferase involved in cell wall biosynthesis
VKALVIAPQPFFTPRGTPFSVYYRTLVTAEAGVSVDLLTYWEGDDVDIPGVRIIRIPRVPLTGGVRVGPSAKKAVLDIVMANWTLGLLLRNKYDFVHAHEESVFLGTLLKRRFGVKLVYDMHSSLPQQLTNFKFTQSRSLIRTFEWLEDRALRNADAVITICPDLADYAVPRMPNPDRHLLIENSIFDDVAFRSDGGAPRRAAEIPPLPADRPLIVYAGTFEPYQGLDLLIAGFALVRQRCPAAFLVLVGGTAGQVEQFKQLARHHGLEGHCLFTGRTSQAAARSVARRAAVLTSPRSKGTNTPLKVYEQLASGVPLVATRIRSHTQVLTDDVCFLVDPTPVAMAEGIAQALSNEERRKQVTTRAAELYETKYSRHAYERKMQQLLALLRS